MSTLYIGLMAGTSTDAVDAVLTDLDRQPPRLLASLALPIPEAVREALRTFGTSGTDELDRMAWLDRTLARLSAQAVQELLRQSGVPARRIRAIGSHGQTLRHVPDGAKPYTLQIGDPNLIAELTGITTVADFRRRDMAAGGQGAPLAPAFHEAFFRRADATVCVVNIGGIANLSVLPADPGLPVTGFDTGPGNTLMDAWTRRHRRVPFDHDGAWAASGRVHGELLECCLADDYFSRPAPKSTGPEYFNLSWLDGRLRELPDIAPADVQATLLALTAQSIARALRQNAPDSQALLVCGGGAHNPALLCTLEHNLPGLRVESTARQGMPPDTLEAVGFAWLARRTLEGLPGNVPTVTGAQGPRILGAIHQA